MLIQPFAPVVNNLASTPVTSFLQLVRYFEQQTTPRERWRVGLEHEKVGVRASGEPVPFDGPTGLWALLSRFERLGFSADREGDHPVALWRGDDKLSLEPGGQFELSAGATESVSGSAALLRSHLMELKSLAEGLDIHFIAGGFRPFGRLDEVPWHPKHRYAIMREFLPNQGREGRLAWEMMKRTATMQFNFDFSSEADAVERMRTGFAVSSIVTALGAASPIVDGQPSGFKSYRAAVWLETDENRSGLLPFAFGPEMSFSRYAEWALDVPMFFVVREDTYVTFPEAMSFRRLWQEGFEHEGVRHHATMADWELHLSTLFPEVRLKKTVEMRGADAGPLPVGLGLAALWRGLVDEPGARQAAWELVEHATGDERQATRRDVPRLGLEARLGRHKLADLARPLLEIAREGLLRIPFGAEDAALLDPVAALAEEGRCPADQMLDEYHAAGGDPTKLIHVWEHP